MINLIAYDFLINLIAYRVLLSRYHLYVANQKDKCNPSMAYLVQKGILEKNIYAPKSVHEVSI